MNRNEFMSMVHPIMSQQEANDVQLAYLLAKRLSKGQFRKELDSSGNPVRYFEHLRRTALNVLKVGIADPFTIEAALLHDAIEDTDDVTLVPALIEKACGLTTAQVVRAVTKCPKANYLDRLRLGATNPALHGRVQLVKLADRLDNMSHLENCSMEFIAKQAKETKEVMLPFFMGVADCVAPEFKNGYNQMLTSLIVIANKL